MIGGDPTAASPNMMADGGPMIQGDTAAGLSEINNGGTHEESPLDGVPMGEGALVEEGETKMGNFIFSDRVINPDTGNTFAEDSKKINKKLGARKNEPFDKRALEIELERLANTQEEFKSAFTTSAGKNSEVLGLGGKSNQYPNGGPTDPDPVTLSPEQEAALAAEATNTEGFTTDVGSGEVTVTPGGGVFKRVTLSPDEQVSAEDLLLPPVGHGGYKVNTLSTQRGLTGDDDKSRELLKKYIDADKGSEIYGTYKSGENVEPIQITYKEFYDKQRHDPNVGNDITESESYEDISTTPHTTPVDTRTAAEKQAEFDTRRRSPLTLANGGPLQLFPNGGGMGDTYLANNPVPQIQTTNIPGFTPSQTLTSDPSAGMQYPTGQGGTGSFSDYAGLAASNAGNLMNLYQGLRPSEQENFQRVDPSLINMDNTISELGRRADSSEQLGREAIRGNASSSGQALTNMIANNVGINENVGRSIADVRQNEANMNTQIQNRAQAQNAQIQQQEAIANAQNRAAKQMALQKGLTGVGTSISGYLGDTNAAQVEADTQEYVRSLAYGGNMYDVDKNGKIVLRKGYGSK